MKKPTKREFRIINLRDEGYSHTEIMKKLGVSSKEVTNAINDNWDYMCLNLMNR